MLNKSNNDVVTKDKNLEVPWNITDILFVFLLILFSAFILLLLIRISVEHQGSGYKLFVYIFPILEILLAYFWLKKKYNISWELLGIRKGGYPFGLSVITGIFIALIMIFIMHLIPFWDESVLRNKSIKNLNYFSALLVPITPFGFAKFVIGPFAEEILFRGFLFGYLRKVIGTIGGVFLQAFFSTLLHPSYVKNAFEIGSLNILSYLFILNILFGLLYHKSNNIYPSMSCHSSFNYFLFLYSL